MTTAGRTFDVVDDAPRRARPDDEEPIDIGPGGDPRQPVESPHPEPSTRRPPAGEPEPAGVDSPDDGHGAEADDVATTGAGATDEATVFAVGKLNEAVEWIERARGRLYDFHQLTGHADELLADAADRLDASGHATWAAEIRLELVGRNVLDGRWTFQVVDEYDETYWTPVRTVRDRVVDALCDGQRHSFERRVKEQRRTHGRLHHEADPPPRGVNHDSGGRHHEADRPDGPPTG